MITFKQFLVEGGAATKKHGTVRASQEDIVHAIALISGALGIPVKTLEDRILGSGRLTHAGHQKDSGDLDIAMNDQELDRDSVTDKMTFLCGSKPMLIGGNIFSYALPLGKRKIQVDLMFVPDIVWAKFSHHASEHSAHKSGVRNELLHSALKFSMEDGKDLRVKDEDGRDVARASRSFKLDTGLERIFKISPMRKDGKGRVKGSEKVSPAEVQAALDEIGHAGKFSPEAEIIRDPNQFAELLFGQSVKSKDMHSTEQLIRLIKKYKSAEQAAIFKDAVHGMVARGFDVPPELIEFKSAA